MTNVFLWTPFVHYIPLFNYSTFRQNESLINLHEAKLNRIPYLNGACWDHYNFSKNYRLQKNCRKKNLCLCTYVNCSTGFNIIFTIKQMSIKDSYAFFLVFYSQVFDYSHSCTHSFLQYFSAPQIVIKESSPQPIQQDNTVSHNFQIQKRET